MNATRTALRALTALRSTTALAAVLAVSLTACGGKEVSFSAEYTDAPPARTSTAGPGDAAGTQPPQSTEPTIAVPSIDTPAGPTRAGGPATLAVVDGGLGLPEVPVPWAPEVASLTTSSVALESAFSSRYGLPAGVRVAGARCAADGSLVYGYDRGGDVTRPLADVLGDQVAYDLDVDGSGTIAGLSLTFDVDPAGAGTYATPEETYDVDAAGAGTYASRTTTYDVDADGSGVWASYESGTLEREPDGSGTWTSRAGVLEIAGDGTGSFNGVPVKVPALEPFPLLDLLPTVDQLAPAGRDCGTLVRIQAGVLFNGGTDTVRPEADDLLEALAAALGDFPDAARGTVRVTGHADSSDGSAAALSQDQADALVAALTSRGLEAQLRADGAGAADPLPSTPGRGSADPRSDRRIEIFVPNV